MSDYYKRQDYFVSKKRGTKAHHIVVMSADGRTHSPAREAGKKKGILPSPLEKWMCRHNRSWKHPRYGAIMEKLGSRKKGK